jgi:hypothetical protein
MQLCRCWVVARQHRPHALIGRSGSGLGWSATWLWLRCWSYSSHLCPLLCTTSGAVTLGDIKSLYQS